MQIVPSINCDCHVIARNNSTLGDEAIQGERSQLAMNKNAEDKQLKSGLDCHVAIAPRNDGQLNDVSTYFDQIDWENLLNKKDTSASNSSRVDFSQPKQDVTTYFDKIDRENLLNKKDTSAQNSCLPQYDETITDFNTLSHSESDVNSGVKNLYNSSRVDFSQPKQDVTTYFDQIDFDKLPNSFVIKCNHGCKWQYIIKDKEAFLQNKRLFDIVKRNMTGWLEQDYSFWGGFEMQYKTAKLNHNVIASKSTSFQDLRGNPADLKEQNKSQSDYHVNQNAVVPRKEKYIEPKILIEPLMRENINVPSSEIQVYCFNGKPELILKLYNDEKSSVCLYDKNINCIDDVFSAGDTKVMEKADENIKQAFDLSGKLSQNFNFVRVDWMLFKNKLWFEEFTFTPYSGFHKYKNKQIYKNLGNKIYLEKETI